jgi:meso-butanediol dehydrogenase / (S,S)-butanediol dehydrogenase / diacetyl reductase
VERRLVGKVAVVTGAGQGIGQGIALRLAREGALVVLAEYNRATAAATALAIRQEGAEALPYPVDISDVEAVRGMVADVVGQAGRIDILVNNAGTQQMKPMLELTETDWDHMTQVNQRGTFFCLQTVARQMVQQVPETLRAAVGAPADIRAIGKNEGAPAAPAAELAGSYGKIVNLSSVAGRRGRPLQAHYAATKASIISITQSAALALAPYRINVNAVCPGIVPTAMWDDIDRVRGALFGLQPGEAIASFIANVPLRRAGRAEDVAAVVAFFCSPDSDYITGQTLNVDGGVEMN